MRVNGTVFVAVVALGLSSTARAEVVDLKALEKRALERHSLVQAGQARTRAAAAGVREARSGYLPHIGVNMDSSLGPGRNIIEVAGYRTSDEIAADNAANRDPAKYRVQGVNALGSKGALIPQWRSTANLVIQTNIYDFGRTAAAVNASEAKLSAAGAEQEHTRAQVIAQVRQAYLNWLSNHELQRMSVSASEDSTRRTERVTALIQEGAKPRGDFAPVESERLLSELELERASGELEEARMLLEQSVGEPLSSSAEPDLKVLDVQADGQIERRTDPSLRMLAHQRAAMEATARLQRKAGSPVISSTVGGGIGVQTSLADVKGSSYALPSYAVGLGITVPIWDGGGSRASADATEARADELRIQIEDAELSRGQERARAKLDAQHAEKRQATALSLVEICKTRVADTEAGYELGAMQFEQVQQARSVLRRAETEVIMARVARAEAVLRFAP
jgi:outer membrane protein